MRAGVLLLAVCGCGPLLAPPVRGAMAGMPGLVSGRQVEVGVSLASAPVVVPHAALYFTDALAFEAGFGLGRWATGWGGVRATFDRGLGIANKLYWDFELGAGGGTRLADPLRSVGFYGGAGVGWRLAYFGFFARARGEYSVYEFWPSVVLGVEGRVAHHLVVDLMGGYAGAWTNAEVAHGIVVQAQLRYFFDVPI
jgi:hypothetical protein